MGHSSLRFLFGAFCKRTQITLLLRLFPAGGRDSFLCAPGSVCALEESKVVSSHPHMLNIRHVMPRHRLRSVAIAVCRGPCAAGCCRRRHFTLSASTFSPPAGVDPGGTATPIITLSTPDSYTGSVALTCVVTSSQCTDAFAGVPNQPFDGNSARHVRRSRSRPWECGAGTVYDHRHGHQRAGPTTAAVPSI